MTERVLGREQVQTGPSILTVSPRRLPRQGKEERSDEPTLRLSLGMRAVHIRRASNNSKECEKPTSILKRTFKAT